MSDDSDDDGYASSPDFGSIRCASIMTCSENEEPLPLDLSFLSAFDSPTPEGEIPAYYSPPALPNRILSLPAELTSRIFDLVDSQWVDFMRNYYVVDDPDQPMDVPLRPGLVVTRVCRLWRRIALRHKKLWTTIVHVTPDRLMSPALLRVYLTLSRPLPLDIVIRAQNFFWPDKHEVFNDAQSDYEGVEDSWSPWTAPDVRRVLDALVPHAARWRRFALHICIGGFDNAALAPLQTVDAPLLEAFEVVSHNQWAREPFKYLADTEDFIAAMRGDEPDPSRRRTKVARLTCARLDIVALHMCAPSFARLTVLELRNSHFVAMPRKVFKNIFESAPRLVHATFMGFNGQITDSSSSDSLDDEGDDELTMPAPCLEVLRSLASDMSLHMWKFLDAPRLKDIVISGMNLDKLPLNIKGVWKASFKPDEVQTPFPNLERLVLESCNGRTLSRHGLLQIARVTSTITQLVLIRDDYMLDNMLRVGSNPVLWPSLRVLKLAASPYLSSRNSHSGDMTALAGLVDWRRAAFGEQCVIEKDVQCRHHVKIADRASADEVLRAQLDELVDEGIVRLDPFRYSDHPWPEWPPRAGEERPTNVRELCCVELLGARDNPWF